MATPEQIAAGVPASANIVAQVAAPGGGMYYLGSDGGVFATGGAQYAGGVNNLQGDTLAGQHQFGANAITEVPGAGGYRITDTAGHQYNFGGSPYQPQPAAPAPNPLYQDPAFLAFINNAGLGVDQAVRDYENQVSLAQRARDAAVAELNDPYGTRSQDRQTLLQNNVDKGRAGAAVQDQLTGYDTETQNQIAKDQADEANAVTKAGQDMSSTIGGFATKASDQGVNTGTDQYWQQFATQEAQKNPDLSSQIYGSLGTKNPTTSS